MGVDKSSFWLAIGVAFLFIFALMVTFDFHWGHVDFTGVTSANIAQRLFGFLVIALALERTNEVIVLARHGQKKAELERQAKMLSAIIANKKETLKRGMVAGTVTEAATLSMSTDIDETLAGDEVRIFNEENEELKRRIQRETLVLGLVIGGLLSLAGLRFIESLIASGFPTDGIAPPADTAATPDGATTEAATEAKPGEGEAADPSTAINAIQYQWLSVLDIFMSTALLAGGSEGIHRIINAATKASSSDDAVTT